MVTRKLVEWKKKLNMTPQITERFLRKSMIELKLWYQWWYISSDGMVLVACICRERRRRKSRIQFHGYGNCIDARVKYITLYSRSNHIDMKIDHWNILKINSRIEAGDCNRTWKQSILSIDITRSKYIAIGISVCQYIHLSHQYEYSYHALVGTFSFRVDIYLQYICTDNLGNSLHSALDFGAFRSKMIFPSTWNCWMIIHRNIPIHWL